MPSGNGGRRRKPSRLLVARQSRAAHRWLGLRRLGCRRRGSPWGRSPRRLLGRWLQRWLFRRRERLRRRRLRRWRQLDPVLRVGEAEVAAGFPLLRLVAVGGDAAGLL